MTFRFIPPHGEQLEDGTTVYPVMTSLIGDAPQMPPGPGDALLDVQTLNVSFFSQRFSRLLIYLIFTGHHKDNVP